MQPKAGARLPQKWNKLWARGRLHERRNDALARCSRFINNAAAAAAHAPLALSLCVQKLFLFATLAILLRPSRVAAGRYQFHVAPTPRVDSRSSQAGCLAGCRPPTHALHLQSGGGGPRKPLPFPRQPTPTATSSDLARTPRHKTLARSIN